MYIHELEEWPNFTWTHEVLAGPLAAVRHSQGRLIGQMEALGFRTREDAFLRAMTDEVVKTSEIEGKILEPDQVRSSLARRLGIDIAGLKPSDRDVDGIVEVMLDATRNYDRPLTAERLFTWQASILQTGRSDGFPIKVGAWRDDAHGPMQVVSGPVGRERVHYQAPEASRVPGEMDRFLDWFEGETRIDPLLKAGVAHFWFVTIHPFADGNGRIARAIADMALARSERIPQRFYSMSAQIRTERRTYYEMLERTQGEALEITPWLEWFLACLGRAIEGSQGALGAVLRKARFWDSVAAGPSLNARQRLVLNRLLDGFQGKLTSTKWAKLVKCSHDTALRDIVELVDRGILARSPEGGRSTSYALARVPPAIA